MRTSPVRQPRKHMGNRLRGCFRLIRFIMTRPPHMTGHHWTSWVPRKPPPASQPASGIIHCEHRGQPIRHPQKQESSEPCPTCRMLASVHPCPHCPQSPDAPIPSCHGNDPNTATEPILQNKHGGGVPFRPSQPKQPAQSSQVRNRREPPAMVAMPTGSTDSSCMMGSRTIIPARHGTTVP